MNYSDSLYSVNDKTSVEYHKKMMVVPENLKVRPPTERNTRNTMKTVVGNCCGEWLYLRSVAY